MFLLLINWCILTLTLPCVCHNKSVLIRPHRDTGKGRILSGYNCSTNDYPYMVKILEILDSYSLYQTCTGTLLTSYHVLTAAHCCQHPNQVAVAGANSPNRAQRYVMAMYPHPYYKSGPPSPRTDICVMLLESKIEYSRYITKVRLPGKALDIDDFDRIYAKKNGLILGWGWPYEPEETEWDYPDELHCSKVPIIPFITCRVAYHGKDLQRSTMCTYEEDNGICYGDSGGPLMSEHNIQIGISSWGIGCGRKGRPDVYTRTDQYLDYLQQFIQTARLAKNTVGFYKSNYMWVFRFIILGRFF